MVKKFTEIRKMVKSVKNYICGNRVVVKDLVDIRSSANNIWPILQNTIQYSVHFHVNDYTMIMHLSWTLFIGFIVVNYLSSHFYHL